MLKMQKPKIHDNTDQDVIMVNKSKLSHIFQQIQQFCIASNNTIALFGLSIAFGITSIATEKFKDIGVVPGETIRAVFIVLSIVSLVVAVRFAIHWYKLKNQHEPEELVKKLLNNKSSNS